MKTKLFSCFLALFSLLLAVANAADAGTDSDAGPKPRISDFSGIEKMPIQAGGRKKPFYTFSVETLQSISGRSTYRDGEERHPAMEVILDLWFHPHAWEDRPLVLVSYRPLREAVGLSAERKLFSLAELFANDGIKERIATVEKLQHDPAKPKLDREQTEVRDVTSRIVRMQSLMNGSAFTVVPGPLVEVKAPAIPEAPNANANAGKPSAEPTPAKPVFKESDWVIPSHAPITYPGAQGEAIAANAVELQRAFLAGDNAAFKAASTKFAEGLGQIHPDFYPSARMMGLETFYGKLHPFRWAWVLYAFAALVLWLTTLAARRPGYRIAWGLVAAGFCLQICGFVCRILIGGRGPVTNMYESVVWVAFGMILFAMILEAIYRSRYMFLGATPIAVVSLILADTQTTILKPAIDPLTPVLRDNFWLSTHVTSITLSYAAFALALGVGHIILGKILWKREVSSALYNYLYRSIQIGVLLLAIGTILGGVWANYSWGRFWDWDPKETWALIALLGYLALLHGRIAGWWKGFGLAVGSVLAFQSVLMAWYGVNFVLGQGLHSYGFGTGGFGYVIAYVIAELLFVALVIIRKKSAQTRGLPEPDMEEVG